MPRGIVMSCFLTRLQEGAIEETLCIYLLGKFRAEHPMSTVLLWFPPELVSAIKEVINERLAFLTALSKKSTMRERIFKAQMKRHPSVSQTQISSQPH